MSGLKFPYYSGNIEHANVIGHVTLERFIQSHKNPTSKTIETIDAINKARLDGNIDDKKRLKETLPSFTPSVMINTNERRRYSNIQKFTGLMQIDLDKIDSEERAIALKEHIFHTHDEMICCYLSPSRVGVKGLMKIEIENPLELHGGLHWVDEKIRRFKALHKAVEKEFAQYEYFDTATKNAILPLFLSYDKDILYRPLETCFEWSDTDWSEVEYINLNPAPKPAPRHTSTNEKYYYDKVTRIISKRINSIVENGHPQVLATSLVLGSRVAAGYLTENEAEYLIENLITSNSYLSKGTKGYIKTAYWAIGQGRKTPKYF